MKVTNSTRSRIIVMLVCALLLLGGLAVWARFFGNPVIMHGMKGNVLRYLQAKYPSVEVTFIHSYYVFLNRVYGVDVQVTADPDLTFTVSYVSGRGYTDSYEERRLDHEATDALRPIIQAALPQATVSASTILPTGQAYTGIHFTPTLAATTSAAIDWKDLGATKESFVRTALAAPNALRANGYSISNCYLWCKLEDKAYGLMIEGAQLELNADELMKLVLQKG